MHLNRVDRKYDNHVRLKNEFIQFNQRKQSRFTRLLKEKEKRFEIMITQIQESTKVFQNIWW